MLRLLHPASHCLWLAPLQALHVGDLPTSSATATPAEASLAASLRLQLLPWQQRLQTAHAVTSGELRPVHIAMLLLILEAASAACGNGGAPGALAAQVPTLLPAQSATALEGTPSRASMAADPARAQGATVHGGAAAPDQSALLAAQPAAAASALRARAWALLRHYAILPLDGFEADVLGARQLPSTAPAGCSPPASLGVLVRAICDGREMQQQLQWVVELARGEAALGAALSDIQRSLSDMRFELCGARADGSCEVVNQKELTEELAAAGGQLGTLGGSPWLPSLLGQFEKVTALHQQLEALVQVCLCACFCCCGFTC